MTITTEEAELQRHHLEEVRLLSLAAERDALRASKDAAYEERNRVVALLASVFPSVRARTAIEGWSEDWHGCIYITLPTGQASWHYHDSHAHLFAHVPEGAAIWDGHTTLEKYERVAATCARRDSLQAKNARLQEALSEMITAFYDAGCHVCGGDCASANPPVWGCPVDVIRRARVLGEKE